jgi:hypothetical protein
VADAFVDRTPIDWTALLSRVQTSRDRVLFENLHRLDLMRRATPQAASGTRRHFLATRLVLAVAALQTVCCLLAVGIALVTGRPAFSRTWQILLALAFAAAGLLLAAAARRDRRSLFLLAAFASVASAFARAAFGGLSWTWPAPVDVIFRGVFPEAFAPATLWLFAVGFPQVRRFTAFDVLARKAATAAWLLGVVLFAANFATAYGVIDWTRAIRLGRNHPDNLFWHLFALAVLPAVATIFVRARRAPSAERRKVARFAMAFAAGTAPFLVCGVIRMALPRVDNWLVTADPSERLWLDTLIMGALAAMPTLSTMAVIADRPFDLQAILSSPWRDRTMRAGVTAIVAAPFVALVLALYRLRHVAIAEIVSGPAAWFLLACAAVGCLLLVTRASLLEALATRSLRRAAGHRERLSAALERVSQARGAREISAVLARELRRGVRAASVSVLVQQSGGAGSRFVDQCGDAGPLAPDAVILAMLGEATGPLDLSTDGPLLALLPQTDRDWVTANGVELAVPLRRRDSTIAAVVLIGAKRTDRGFDRRDRWLMTTIVTGAAAAWDVASPGANGQAGSPGSGDLPLGDEAAFECRLCGLVAESRPLACCGGDVTLASLPRHLGSKFVVERRIGAGGMGVVYLARDVALDRQVALKTLPDLRDDTVARLRDEARAMAALNHESLATIFGLELWRRTPVLVVEYLPGGTLAGRLINGPLPLREAVAIGIRLAGALAYMHKRGVLHRDLKPSNIAFAATGAPKLLDFGLATLTGSVSNDGRASADAGRHRTFAGTPAYLPPEAYRGAAANPGFDLWALSVVVLESITGRNPFEPDAGGLSTRRALPVDLAGGDADTFALTAFFERALDLEPRSRFRTGLEMQSALEALAKRTRD